MFITLMTFCQLGNQTLGVILMKHYSLDYGQQLFLTFKHNTHENKTLNLLKSSFSSGVFPTGFITFFT